MSPNSVILYIFYSKTIKQCLAFIADLKIKHLGYKEETGIIVPTVCLWLELGKFNSPSPNLLLHTRTHSVYREIKGLPCFLAQFPSFIIRDYLSHLHMVPTQTREKEEKGKRREKKQQAGFCLYKQGEMENASMY